jgi:hypothetical protein
MPSVAMQLAAVLLCARRALPKDQEHRVAKKAQKKTVTRSEYTKADVKELRAHSKAKTPVSKIAKLMKRSEGSLRQKALKLGIRLGHRR